jgi:hypothetical protein
MADADPATDPATDPAATDPAAQPDITDWKAEARKHEDRAKAWKAKADAGAEAAKKLADIEAANQTAQEKAEARAAAAEKAAVEREHAAQQRIASAEVRAALTGVVPDPAAVVEDLDLSKFLTETGEIDTDKVTALKAKYEALAPAQGPRAPARNPAQGSGGKQPTLGDLIRDAEAKRDPRESIRLKSAQLRGIQNNRG